jgi:hypothetical protein
VNILHVLAESQAGNVPGAVLPDMAGKTIQPAISQEVM